MDLPKSSWKKDFLFYMTTWASPEQVVNMNIVAEPLRTHKKL